MRDKCPKCGNLLVSPVGRKGILLAGEFPGKDEIIQGVPFVGKTGDLLRAELAIASMSIQECRLTNLWLHGKNEETCDVQWHLTNLVNEIQSSTHVLLMGSELTQLLFQASVSELSGLEMKTDMFKATIFISPNPAQMFYAPLGEFRLALSNFVKAVRKDGK